MSAVQSAGYEEITPDSDTVMNIHTMTNRSIELFREREPVVKAGFDFAPNGYTEIVSNGDGDFLTADTLWDMKVYRSRLTKDHTLQVLMYWIMGQHSGQEIYNGITNIGLFNPRTNTAYTLKVKNIPAGVIETVEREVICY